MTIENQVALFKQQQSQVAKVLKRTLAKLKETKGSLDIVKADLDAAMLKECDLSKELLEARRETEELRDFHASIIKVVADTHENQNLKEKLIEIIGNVSFGKCFIKDCH
jgi:hypothetical protein